MFNEAQAMLKSIKANNSLRCKGVVGFFRAGSVGDDIQLYGEDGEVIATLYGLRQQVCTLSHDLFITLLQQSIHPSAFWPEPVALLTVYQVTAVILLLKPKEERRKLIKKKKLLGKSFYLEIENLIDFTISF